MLVKTASMARYAYNWALAKWIEMYDAHCRDASAQKPTAITLSGIWTRERPAFANETARCAQQRAIFLVGEAFQRMWNGLAKYPKFHKKGKHRDSFYVDSSKGKIDERFVYLPKIGAVRLAEPLRYQGKIISYTVSTYAGEWYVAVRVELDTDVRPRCVNKKDVVGVDVGLKHLAVASDGSVLDNPAQLKRMDKHLKVLQRRLSRSKKLSNNYNKRLKRKQKLQRRINSIRADYAHKYTTMLAKSHGIIVTENLSVQAMLDSASDKHLRRTFQMSMMTELIRQVSYKAQTHVLADRHYPSSRRCSRCGTIKQKLGLDERVYKCSCCGYIVDRDMNAAYNLMQAGKVKPGVPVDSTCQSVAK